MLMCIIIKLTINVIYNDISTVSLWLRFKSNKSINAQFIELKNVFVNVYKYKKKFYC